MGFLRWIPVLLVGIFVIAGCTKSGPKPESESGIEGIHPYLQIAGADDDPVVIWTTEIPQGSQVSYGLSGGPLDMVELDNEAVINHFLTLPNLKPDTEYDYQVVAADLKSDINTFRTLPMVKSDGTSDPFTMIVYGDNRSNPDLHERVIDQMILDGIPSLVVSTGDLVYSGRDSIRWFREFLQPADRLFSQAPIMLSLGNHDVDCETPKPYAVAQWWLDRFAFPGVPNEVGYSRWFSYEAGGIHMIHLDSTVPENADQQAWFEADLLSPESVNSDFRVVVFHYPPYCSGGHHSNEIVRDAWETLMQENGVNLVFNGHNHYYQRTLPCFGGGLAVEVMETKDGLDVVRSGQPGVVYVITGGGGAPLYKPKPADFVAVSVKERHFIRLEYTAGEIHCTVINEDGAVIDEFLVSH